MNWVPLECRIKDSLQKGHGVEPWVGKITFVGRLVWSMAQRLWLGSDKLGGSIGWEGNMYMGGGGGGGVSTTRHAIHKRLLLPPFSSC